MRETIEDFIKTAGDRGINVELKKSLAEAGEKEEIHSKNLDKWISALPVKNNAQSV